MMLDKGLFYVVLVLFGIIVGFLLCDYLNKDEIVKTVVKWETETKTDTVFVHKIDTVHVSRTEIKYEQLRDTVYLGNYTQIKRFTASKPFLYGNTYISGEVIGEVLKMDITNDFKLPTITNTITNTKTVTNTIKPKGLYLSGYLDTEFKPSFGGQYLDNDFIFSYQFKPSIKLHQIGVSKRIF